MKPRCHYCSAVAKSRDHIVPRSILRELDVNADFYHGNVVPACVGCNKAKASYRSNCECSKCANAWFLVLRLKPDLAGIPVWMAPNPLGPPPPPPGWDGSCEVWGDVNGEPSLYPAWMR